MIRQGFITGWNAHLLRRSVWQIVVPHIMPLRELSAELGDMEGGTSYDTHKYLLAMIEDRFYRSTTLYLTVKPNYG